MDSTAQQPASGEDRNFAATGVAVPRTEWFRTKVGLVLAYCGEKTPAVPQFLKELTAAAERVSLTGPWFLRTGMGSGKHRWEKTCRVRLLHDDPSYT